MTADVNEGTGPPDENRPTALSATQQKNARFMLRVFVTLLEWCCDLSEQVQTHLRSESEFATKLNEARKVAQEELSEFRAYLDNGIPLPYFTMILVCPGKTGPREEVVRGTPPIFNVIESINTTIHVLTQEVLKVAPHTATLWAEPEYQIKRDVEMILRSVNMALDKIESLSLAVMGDDFYESDLMFARHVDLSGTADNGGLVA